jgi:hypothetical protein
MQQEPRDGVRLVPVQVLAQSQEPDAERDQLLGADAVGLATAPATELPHRRRSAGRGRPAGAGGVADGWPWRHSSPYLCIQQRGSWRSPFPTLRAARRSRPGMVHAAKVTTSEPPESSTAAALIAGRREGSGPYLPSPGICGKSEASRLKTPGPFRIFRPRLLNVRAGGGAKRLVSNTLRAPVQGDLTATFLSGFLVQSTRTPAIRQKSAFWFRRPYRGVASRETCC